MAPNAAQPPAFNIVIIGQSGRLAYEALLFTASLRHFSPGFTGALFIAEPQPGPRWETDPRMPRDVKDALGAMGAQILPFTSAHFGSRYPYGNKIECLTALPAGEPFIFFDSDTIITGDITTLPLDFDRPAASMQRTGTWPVEELYWPGYTAIWKSLYDRFDLDFESSLDRSQPDEYWERYLYFNAGWFYGADPVAFGELFTQYALSIRDNPPPELVIQPLDPWLDQIALPLVIHALGGGRPAPALDGLDGDISNHYRVLPMFYARARDTAIAALETVAAPNKVKKILKQYDPFKRMIYQGRGQKVRALFDQNDLPRHEKALRNKIKSAGYWMR
ncbi:hypothetical protein SAMN04488005_0847 [Yoonia tamlensis]|uniref:Uncharacterized protein n=1 Tax=Yoonia tamlensis TaxID=390270 RepID=A0A1I6G0F7_9RHOB|nr:hypothetical protein [Yoonia tamlensis]SFR35641.1 hypothetical protein SAMN04488005_0847 [Yoonia tamlensis]